MLRRVWGIYLLLSRMDGRKTLNARKLETCRSVHFNGSITP